MGEGSEETRLDRNRHRDEPIPETGLRAIAGRFEPPQADLETDTETLDSVRALDRLEAAVLTRIER